MDSTPLIGSISDFDRKQGKINQIPGSPLGYQTDMSMNRNQTIIKATVLIGASCIAGWFGASTLVATDFAHTGPIGGTAVIHAGGANGFPNGCTNTNGGSGSPNTETHVGGNGTGTGTGTGGGVGVENSQPNGPGGGASDEDSAAAGGTGCPASAPGVFGADGTP